MAKIAYVTNSGEPGGMEKHVLDLVSGMIGLGHEVFVWCGHGPFAHSYEKAGAKVTIKSINFDIDLTYINSLAKFLSQQRIEIVHSHELKASVNSLLAGYLAGVKFRISHTHTPISTWRVSPIKKIPTTFVYSIFVNLFSTYEIALTGAIRKIKISEGISEKKLIVIPNGIDYNGLQEAFEKRSLFRNEIMKEYKIPPESFIVGNLSRLTEEKGYELLVKAFSRLNLSNKFLFIAGGGKMEKDIRDLTIRLGISEKTIITGKFYESNKVKYYSTLDLLVFPSYAEGFGYVAVEGMAAGVPVLASDLLVLKEVGGTTISYFKTGDEDSLCNQIENLLNTWEETQSLVPKARERVESL